MLIVVMTYSLLFNCQINLNAQNFHSDINRILDQENYHASTYLAHNFTLLVPLLSIYTISSVVDYLFDSSLAQNIYIRANYKLHLAEMSEKYKALGQDLSREDAEFFYNMRKEIRLLEREEMNVFQKFYLNARDYFVYGHSDGPSFLSLEAKYLAKGISGSELYQAVIESSIKSGGGDLGLTEQHFLHVLDVVMSEILTGQCEAYHYGSI